jgi:hypothetical protein
MNEPAKRDQPRTLHEMELLGLLVRLAEAAAGCTPRPGLVYQSAAGFLLRHGDWHREHAPAPGDEGAPKCCYGNAIAMCVKYPGVRYVEGYALAPSSAGGLPIPHAWNLDAAGRLIDITWRCRGLAYLGVVFALERADDATWNGDASILDDCYRGYPLFQAPWRGEISWAGYRPSDVLRAMQRKVARSRTRGPHHAIPPTNR